MLKACLNGPRSPDEHPALPITPAQLAREAAAVASVGVHAVHLHVKDDRGRDTFDVGAVAETLQAVQAACPGVPVGVTTGAWALPDPDRRVAAIRAWRQLPVRPSFASVNWHEPGAGAVAAELVSLGIDIEAGLWDGAAVEAWLASPHRDRCVRVLVELPDGVPDAAVEQHADELLRLVDRGWRGGDTDIPVFLHGLDSTAWPALKLAASRRLSTRIGLEDTLVLPDGSPAPDNASLVRAARQLIFEASRRRSA